MSLDKIEIPVSRPRSRTRCGVLILALSVMCALSAAVIHEHVYQLRWIERHGGWDRQLPIRFGDGKILTVPWRAGDTHRSPHHRLAIASGILNVLVSLFVGVLFAASVRLKKNIQQHRLLILAFGPALALATAALVSSFAMHFARGDGSYMLHQMASSPGPSNLLFNGQHHIDRPELESWSCGLGYRVPNPPDFRQPFIEACGHAVRGRRLLVPLWFALAAAAGAAWAAFRGVPGWRERRGGDNVLGGEEERLVSGGEGKIRLP
ncbi:hypothetical protein DL764_006405 [Monosporascus ibericus]|uniref:Uncharacterized protein n=1 Tax=Monosporascus ibericus TaxID=155417 RepID=A0A4V1XA36_9PEZI|nr:hypothetical protein DL764_006405 [Monosporascus ibericus]